jgi:hypothetical protein
LKASDVSALFDGLPELNRCAISFSDRPVYRKSEHAQKLKEKGEVRVFSLREMYLGDGIDIEVVAVPSEFCSAVRDCLLVTHRSELRDWFLHSPNYVGQESIGRPKLEVHFDLASQRSRVS